MRRLLLAPLLASAALAGCAVPGTGGTATVFSAYAPITVPAEPPEWPITEEGPRLTLELRQGVEESVGLVRAVAAQCWMPVLQAEALVLDPEGPVIVMTGPDSPVLAVRFLPSEGLAMIRMTGATMYNPAKVTELLRFLTRAERAGEVECPSPPPPA